MLWHTKLGDKVKSSPAVINNMVIVGCEDKKLYALDSHTGKVLWTFASGDRISSSPSVMDGVAYVGSWVVDDGGLNRCFQLMETSDAALFDVWFARWSDLVSFEVLPVITSAEAAARAET